MARLLRCPTQQPAEGPSARPDIADLAVACSPKLRSVMVMALPSDASNKQHLCSVTPLFTACTATSLAAPWCRNTVCNSFMSYSGQVCCLFLPLASSD